MRAGLYYRARMVTDRDSNSIPPSSLWGRVRFFLESHPTLATFFLMAPAMVAILLLSIQSVALEPTQRLAMVFATIGLAAAASWIISIE